MSAVGFLAFFAVVLVALAILHGYLWWRLVRSTTAPGSRGRRIGGWLVVVGFLASASAATVSRVLPRGVATVLAWPGYTWLGFAFYLFLFLVVAELLRPLLRRRIPTAPVASEELMPVDLSHSDARGGLDARTPAEPVASEVLMATGHDDSDAPRESDPPSAGLDRRLFLSRGIALGAGVAALAVTGYGMSRALGEPVIRQVPVRLRGLDPALNGFRIAMFTDAHLGTSRRRAKMAELVELTNATDPDLIAIVGDLVDGSVEELRADVAPLAELTSREGTFFVTGNHEYYVGVEQWTDYLPDLGVRVLANERLTLSRGDARLDLAGINDITGEQGGAGPDYAAALGDRSTEHPVILLAHQPIDVERAAGYDVDLQLSGHTHGGQMWPAHYLVGLAQGTVSGLSRVGDTQLYVSTGAGFWGPPVRVGADPEIAVIELLAGDG